MWALLRVILTVCSLLFPVASAMTRATYDVFGYVIGALEPLPDEASVPEVPAQDLSSIRAVDDVPVE